jgi:alpha-L-rhamnosidase
VVRRLYGSNHYSYGAVCEFLFAHVAGIRPDPDRPGFEHFLLEPQILPELGFVEASHRSAYGLIEVEWQVEGNEVSYNVTIPADASATLHVGPQYFDAKVDGTPIGASYELPAGHHQVTFNLVSNQCNEE